MLASLMLVWFMIMADELTTVRLRLTLFVPAPLVTVKFTALDPMVAYTWFGFWAGLVDPSPKSHCQEVGLPVEVSVN
jgi:hypothetical protein